MSLPFEKLEMAERPARTIATHAHHAARWTLDALRPSIFTKTPRKELHATAWLDGLRGFAAFLVYWQHHQGWARVGITAADAMETSWGYQGQYYFAQLPGIRLFFTGGHIAVSCFFIISGHVLSAKPLALIHAREYLKLEDNLSGAMFRRWPRLFLPALFTTLIYATSWHIVAFSSAFPEHQATFAEEMVEWYNQFKSFSWVFKTDEKLWLRYNFHLWSIAVEMRGSVIIFTSLLAFSRCRKNARLLCEVGLIFYFLYIVDGMLYAMFCGGMLLCDLDNLARHGELPAFFYSLEPYKKPIFWTLFFSGIYLGGVPSIDFHISISLLEESPGWMWLAKLKPTSVSESDYKWFYLFWAAIFTVSSISRLPVLKAFFETRFNQYLGRISFSLYLIHGPILWTIGDRLYLAAGWAREINIEGVEDWIGIFPISKAGPLGLEIAFWVPHLIILPLTLWLAEVCTRVFDRPSIKFARWSYSKFVAQDYR
ncbi:Acyltransferase 3 [Hyaloscypha variabilis]